MTRPTRPTRTTAHALRPHHALRLAVCAVLAACLGAAGGTARGAGGDADATRLVDAPSVGIGGQAEGFEGCLQLSLNRGLGTLTLTRPGTFRFPLLLPPGTDYEVRVAVQPPAQHCEVLGGSGTASAEVGDVQLRCRQGRVQGVHALGAGTGGAGAASALVEDAHGNLYAMTREGGAHGRGAVIRIAPDGAAQVLHSFDGGEMDQQPQRLSLDADGNLYGVATFDDLHPQGVVFRLSPQGAYKVLHEFDDEADGSLPSSPLLLAGDGRFYGLTGTGGRHGGGTLYRFAPASGRVEVLHAYRDVAALQARDPEQTWDSEADPEEHADDLYSPSGELAEDPRTHTLYGTAIEGGRHGQGGIFSYSRHSRSLRSLASMPAAAPAPSYGLVRTRDGELFGLLPRGGEPMALFRYKPGGVLRVQQSLASEFVPRTPRGVLVEGSDGRLYGISELGGAHDAGALYSFDPAQGNALLHYSFGAPGTTSGIGSYPASSLLITRGGEIHGITDAGGPHADGVVFRIR